jgi:hypothetical protein
MPFNKLQSGVATSRDPPDHAVGERLLPSRRRYEIHYADSFGAGNFGSHVWQSEQLGVIKRAVHAPHKSCPILLRDLRQRSHELRREMQRLRGLHSELRQ